MAIAATRQGLGDQLDVSFEGISGAHDARVTVASAFDMLESGQIGLMTITLSQQACDQATAIRILAGGNAQAAITISV
jgi:hypothetical protein